MEQAPQRIDFPSEEEKTLKYWDEIDAFKTSLEMSKGKPEFTFYDGPPFATGTPHHGHLLCGTIKDSVTRFAHQTGHYVERRFGWDCHGLPIEFEIDKAHGIRTREDVLKMGIPSYNAKCRAIVMKYSEEWKTTVRRIGRWIDMENNYKTMDLSYMESVWWVFKQLHSKGLVYQGFKVMPYSTSCTTPISNFEASSNHKNVSDPAVVVSFPLVGQEDVSLVAWTTTPWTLPCNLALVVKPDMDYVKVHDLVRKQTFVMAEARLSQLYKDVKLDANNKEFKLVERLKGADLVGLQYVPPFDYFATDANKGAFRVVAGDFITSDAGTGVVHAAPAYGEDDFKVCLANGIVTRDDYKRPAMNAVDANGFYSADIKDFVGRYVKDADKDVVKALKERSRLVQMSTIKHNYPYCWRSNTPLIYRAVSSWFIRVEQMRDSLLKSNETSHWVPKFVKEERFANWLNSAVDWAVSRNRYWGTPIPLWVSEDGEEQVAVGSVDELEQLTGVRVTDLHREFIDHLTIPSKQGKGVLRRVEEVFDCWFESGSMPYAQLHYPFENKERFEKKFPAQFIAEGIDQTRGWFYSLLVLSTILYDKAPFQNLIVNGLVLNEKGEKMSKSLRNYTEPKLLIDQYGSDALRLYLIDSPVVRGDVLKFKDEGVKDVLKNLLLPWYNAYRFTVQMALRHEKFTGRPFVPDQANALASTNTMDRWIMGLCHALIKAVREEMAAYRLYTIVPLFTKFVEELTRWHIRVNRERFKNLKGEAETVHSMNVLYEVVLKVTLTMSPFTPFLSEHLYQNLKRVLPKEKQMDSVHYEMIPEVNESLIDTRLNQAVARMQTVIDMGRSSRDRRNVPIKTPLRDFVVMSENPQYLEDVHDLEQYVIYELNVENVVVRPHDNLTTLLADPDHKRLGLRLKNDKKAVYDVIAKLTQDELHQFSNTGEITINGYVLTTEDIKLARLYNGPKERYEPTSDREVTTLLDMEVDAERVSRGVAREVTNRVQRLRKKSKLLQDDPLNVYYYTKDAAITAAIAQNQDYILITVELPLVFTEQPPANFFASELATVSNKDDFQIWFTK
ncbi:hypothetical protein SAMD00019534_008780 [Acytostelium subglobosum LB1]|uniref:hypothetical protein n=1 Tax=Acytostelium subglobosum LB1 TaxID=1410327 RepID=UPI0006448098|nr:hypothetical protein SAMD00019534_008780 [Acytostelium subglobosum LB1]GAM17703.1 hypothetical protein SAMD00019534_008780 [Acytostelium subglobosum LB1]|eukprot:XP_012758299.1 hypothetical protein SAMD00019534_008780 [Acytostelium subglobosum LB1]